MVKMTFEQLVQHGRDSGANIVNGMPWSFKIEGRSVSHENDNCYLITTAVDTFRMTRDDILTIPANGALRVDRIGTDKFSPDNWWLISREDAEKVQSALEMLIMIANRWEKSQDIAENFAAISIKPGAKDALHAFESGLHTSTVVPADFAVSS